MKVTLSEIKKNLQGTNNGVEEAKNQINDLEHKEAKKKNPTKIQPIRTRRRRKIFFLNEGSICSF